MTDKKNKPILKIVPNEKDELIFINPADFKSIELKIRIENTTSRTRVPPEKPVTFIRFLEQGLVLEVPSRTCAVGHHMAIVVNVSDGSVFEATCVAHEVRNASKDSDTATLGLVQYEKEHWDRLRHIFTARQSAIDDFLTLARGR